MKNENEYELRKAWKNHQVEFAMDMNWDYEVHLTIDELMDYIRKQDDPWIIRNILMDISPYYPYYSLDGYGWAKNEEEGTSLELEDCLEEFDRWLAINYPDEYEKLKGF